MSLVFASTHTVWLAILPVFASTNTGWLPLLAVFAWAHTVWCHALLVFANANTVSLAQLAIFAEANTSFLAQHSSEIVTLTLEHLWLTGSAMLFATAIGVPLGILLTRRTKLAGPVLTVANIIQTIPSLALFGFLLPVPWLGERAARIAIVALTGYALLPILRNTYAGIRSIDPAVIDVAHALGMTGWQRLRKVELPLAAGVILAGLRTATVTCVGIATIAAAVGAGGLGEFIFRGVASVDNRLVLAGAIPAALLALAADTLLGWAEHRLGQHGKRL